MKFDSLLKILKKDCLVVDLETCARDSSGNFIDLRRDYEGYVANASIKFFGAYSYKHDKTYLLEYKKHAGKIKDLVNEHDVIVGFNSEDFDYPIMKNNGLVEYNKRHTQVDCMVILGKSVFKTRSGYPYKDRGNLMEYKFKKNSLKCMAKEMGLETQKGDIDYHIFQQDSWSETEVKEIKTYLHDDVMSTKQMFDALWDYWKPFTEMLDVKFVADLSWIRNSIASLTYKCACSALNIKPTYSDKKSKKEDMGGRVILPKQEEIENVWYIDFASLYPHVFCMFNLFAETVESDSDAVFHDNGVFKTRGYYNIKKEHALSIHVKQKLKEKTELKKKDEKNPMVYALKILLNSLYGAVRSSIFEQIHTPNAGWDCCYLGQQIHRLTEKEMNKFGFRTMAGDTDSLFLLAEKEEYNNREYVEHCLEKVIQTINEYVPFPVETFNIDIEAYVKYLMYPFSEQPVLDENGEKLKKGNRLVKELKGRKKNYLYIYNKDGEEKIEIVGLPIKKDNATHLGIKIYNEVLKPLIHERQSAKFSPEFIKETVNKYLEDPKIMQLISREYKVKPAKDYKRESQIQAQISRGYFNGGDGVINLIKNKKLGNAGKGSKYCTVAQAVENNLTVDDLDLQKLFNELQPFIAHP